MQNCHIKKKEKNIRSTELKKKNLLDIFFFARGQDKTVSRNKKCTTVILPLSHFFLRSSCCCSIILKKLFIILVYNIPSRLTHRYACLVLLFYFFLFFKRRTRRLRFSSKNCKHVNFLLFFRTLLNFVVAHTRAHSKIPNTHTHTHTHIKMLKIRRISVFYFR